MSQRRMKTMDGNTAAAYVAYPFTEVAAIYPISPSCEMGEMADAWSAEGKKNLFGSPAQVVEMQSEGGSSGALHGILQGGALATSFTASQGLLLMIPNMNRIAGELLPGVLHVASRGAGNSSFSIFAEHNDVMSTRSAGFAILASRSVQDVMNLGAIAHLAAIKGSIPFLHFFDGYRTSHEMQKINVLEYEELDKLLDHEAVAAFRARSLAPRRPHANSLSHGSSTYFQLREAVNPYYNALPGIVAEYMQAINKLTGSNYDLFTYHGHPEAQRVVVAMGSGCSVLEEAVDVLNKRGEKVGLVTVHLFRPFVPEKLREALPKSVEKIAVLDRCKEQGSGGEPLYLDVRAGLCGDGKSNLVVVGGRYGISNKNFTPAQAQAVFDNLAQEEPRDHFTVGINDDLTGTSLAMPAEPIEYRQEGLTSCKFWGLGADGTVGANKSSVKIIGDHTSLYAQAFFSYDSRKSGGVTVSHLRFGPSPIKSAYLVDRADFVACHNPAYVKKYDMVQDVRPGGSFLLNCGWSDAELGEQLPAAMKRHIAANKIKLYTINAVDIAIELGLPGRVNMIMQSAFFALAKIIPLEEAMGYLRQSAHEAYGKQGQAIVDKNLAALERGLSDLHEFRVPEEWKNARDEAPADLSHLPAFYRQVVQPMLDQKGDDLPVSAFKDYAAGNWPFGVSTYEKRGLAVSAPRWVPENCIQCNQCSFVCPHAVIRLANIAKKPGGGTLPELARITIRYYRGLIQGGLDGRLLRDQVLEGATLVRD